MGQHFAFSRSDLLDMPIDELGFWLGCLGEAEKGKTP